MKRLFTLYFLVFLSSWSPLSGQTFFTYQGKVIDSTTGIGIEGAHVYHADILRLGTITNSEGVFVLKSRKRIEQLAVSHVGYFAKVQPIETV